MPTVERPDMSDYGVPADPAGALPWSWAQERLVANKNYWFVTASAGGRPQAMPVWGVWLPETERFWFSCSPNARKLRNLQENPQCAVLVDDTVECVSVEGTARRVTVEEGDPGIAAVISAYLAKYWPDETSHTEMEGFLRSHATVEFTPDRAFGIIERETEFAERATRWRW